jgi:hypothetical protein
MPPIRHGTLFGLAAWSVAAGLAFAQGGGGGPFPWSPKAQGRATPTATASSDSGASTPSPGYTAHYAAGAGGTATPGAAQGAYPAAAYSPAIGVPTTYAAGVPEAATYGQATGAPHVWAGGAPAGIAPQPAPAAAPLPMQARWQHTPAAAHPPGCQSSCCRTTPYGQPQLPPLESAYGYRSYPAGAYGAQQAYHYQAMPAPGYGAVSGYAVQTGATSGAVPPGTEEPTALATDLPPSARNYPERQVLGYVKKRNWLQRLGDALWPF